VKRTVIINLFRIVRAGGFARTFAINPAHY
jgi:hypothetical protein